MQSTCSFKASKHFLAGLLFHSFKSRQKNSGKNLGSLIFDESIQGSRVYAWTPLFPHIALNADTWCCECTFIIAFGVQKAFMSKCCRLYLRKMNNLRELFCSGKQCIAAQQYLYDSTWFNDNSNLYLKFNLWMKFFVSQVQGKLYRKVLIEFMLGLVRFPWKANSLS